MLNNKVALVTGGSSGIGKAIARRLAQEGASIAVVASSDLDKAQGVAEEIKASGGAAQGYVTDVRDSEAVRALVAAVGERQGAVDILVTSAGVFIPNPIGESDPSILDRVFDVNVKATYNCISAVVPIMKSRGSGRIICLSSVAAKLGIAGFSAYCASKAAVAMLVQSLALELAPHNININALAPGNTATPMNEAVRSNPAQIAHFEALRSITPSPRTFSDPKDIAQLALFLASDGGRAVHGSLFVIDEGVSAGVRI